MQRVRSFRSYTIPRATTTRGFFRRSVTYSRVLSETIPWSRLSVRVAPEKPRFPCNFMRHSRPPARRLYLETGGAEKRGVGIEDIKKERKRVRERERENARGRERGATITTTAADSSSSLAPKYRDSHAPHGALQCSPRVSKVATTPDDR